MCATLIGKQYFLQANEPAFSACMVRREVCGSIPRWRAKIINMEWKRWSKKRPRKGREFIFVSHWYDAENKLVKILGFGYLDSFYSLVSVGTAETPYEWMYAEDFIKHYNER